MTRSETDQRRALPHEYRYDGYHEVCVSHCSLSSPLASSALGALPLSCQPILQDIAALSPPVAHLSMAKVNSFSRSLSLSLSLSLYGVQDDFFNQLPIDYGVQIRRVLYLPAGVQHDSSNPHLTFLFRLALGTNVTSYNKRKFLPSLVVIAKVYMAKNSHLGTYFYLDTNF